MKNILSKIGSFIRDYFFLLVLILLVFVIFKACTYENKEAKAQLLYNKRATIVKIGNETAPSKDKFHTPTVYKLILIRDINDTTKFAEWEVDDIYTYYNYKIGDTVCFDYISKKRWFNIK